MQTDLQKLIKIKKYPAVFQFENYKEQSKNNEEFNRILKEITDTIESMFIEFLKSEMKQQEYFNIRLEEMGEIMNGLKTDIQSKVEKIEGLVESGRLQGEKGEKGDRGIDGIGIDGKDADEKKIIKEVIKKIPVPQDGRDYILTPQDKKEISKIIAEIIPKPKDGKDAKDIKPEILKELKKYLSKITMKGGMGMPQHETHSVNSGTTTITATYNIAANGNAIWAYYQGQFLVKGTHYTVSGKTLTLTFTPTDSTSIDLVYIRT